MGMMNLLGRSRKGSTFSPSGGGGRRTPPGTTTQAPGTPRAPSRRRRTGSARDHPEYFGGGRNQYKRAKQKLDAIQKGMEMLMDPDHPGPLDFLPQDPFTAGLGFYYSLFTPSNPNDGYYDFEGAGWRRACTEPTAGFGKVVGRTYSTIPVPSNTCFLADFVPVPGEESVYGESIPSTVPGRDRIGTIYICEWQNVTFTRCSVAEAWSRPLVGPATPPAWVPPAPQRIAYVLPPAPRLPRPPSPDTTPQPGLGLRRPKPYQRPAAITAVGGSGGITRRLGYHNKLPPGPRVKERKMYKMPAALAAALNLVGEGGEIIDALHDNLPKNLQAKGYRDRFGEEDPRGLSPTPQQKLRALYPNLDKVDMDGFARDMIINQAEDYVFGKLGKAGGELARQGGWLAGPQAGWAL